MLTKYDPQFIFFFPKFRRKILCDLVLLSENDTDAVVERRKIGAKPPTPAAKASATIVKPENQAGVDFLLAGARKQSYKIDSWRAMVNANLLQRQEAIPAVLKLYSDWNATQAKAVLKFGSSIISNTIEAHLMGVGDQSSEIEENIRAQLTILGVRELERSLVRFRSSIEAYHQLERR
jgi:hypothetical protein